MILKLIGNCSLAIALRVLCRQYAPLVAESGLVVEHRAGKTEITPTSQAGTSA